MLAVAGARIPPKYSHTHPTHLVAGGGEGCVNLGHHILQQVELCAIVRQQVRVQRAGRGAGEGRLPRAHDADIQARAWMGDVSDDLPFTWSRRLLGDGKSWAQEESQQEQRRPRGRLGGSAAAVGAGHARGLPACPCGWQSRMAPVVEEQR